MSGLSTKQCILTHICRTVKVLLIDIDMEDMFDVKW